MITLWRRTPADLRLFGVFLVALLPARIAACWTQRWMAIDGGYYTEVARHVRDGLGLTTNVSLYQMGYTHFPYPTCIYPLWPLVLGYAARLGDLNRLAHWLPLGFYFTAIMAAFGFGRRLAPRELFPSVVPGLHMGHVFGITLAMQREFVVFTTIPYTEGLAETLLFGFLWRLAANGPRLGLGSAVESGVWLALLYFARAQLIVVAMAIACAYALRIAIGPDRGRVTAHAGVALGVTGLALFGWWLYIRGFVMDAGLLSLLRFDQNRTNALLAPIDVIVGTNGVFAFLWDRIQGLGVGWDMGGASSYYLAFYGACWALPGALLLLLHTMVVSVRTVGWRESVRGGVEGLRRPEAFVWVALVALSLGGVFSLQLAHKHYNGSWYFAKRQDLVALPAFALSLWWLLRAARVETRGLSLLFGVTFFGSSFMSGIHEVMLEAEDTKADTRVSDDFGPLVTWLKETDAAQQKAGSGPLVVIMDAEIVQRVAWRTTTVGYHWFDEHTSYDDVQTMSDSLGATYIITRVGVHDWDFQEDEPAAFRRDWVRDRNPPLGYTVYARQGPGSGGSPVTGPLEAP